ncbi:7TM diverse intracellular signaling domain-containing protein [Desulfobacterales bacterium HSG17]|nr:7TM diverse intracellular signaling domain-containing protein [Desulfobacterales bacterium HSG17]
MANAFYTSILLILALAHSTVCAGPIVMQPQTATINPTPHLLFFEDVSNTLTLDDLFEQPLEIGFQPQEHENINFGMTHSAWWLRFELLYEGRFQNPLFLLDFGFPNYVDKADIYFRHHYKLVEKGIGDWQTINAGRYSAYRNDPVDIPFSGSIQKTEFLIRVKTSTALYLPLRIYTKNSYQQHKLRQFLLFGLYYGLVLGLALFNLYIYFALKELERLYYVLYILAKGMFFFYFNGMITELFPDIDPEFLRKLIFLFGGNILLWGCLFLKEFLNTRNNAVVIDRFFTGIITFVLLTVLFSLYQTIEVLTLIITALVLIVPFLAILAALISYLNGFKPGRFILIAFIPVSLGAICNTLTAFRVLEYTSISYYGLQIGSAIEIIAIAIAIADRINTLKAEREAALVSAEQSNLRLEETVAVRTVSLQAEIQERIKTEAALKKACETAENAEKRKSLFLASMSHEIRTPLNAIFGLTDRVLKTTLTARQYNYIKSIKFATSTLNGTINDIIDFSKMEADKLPLEKRPFHLLTEVESVIDMFAGKISDKKLMISLDIDFDIPAILIGDALRLRQIMINLIGNAVKFTDSGSIRLIVQKRQESKSNVQLLFSIQDTGIGISKEYQAMLFSAFSQADTSITRKFGGTGLGRANACKCPEAPIMLSASF